MQYNGVNYYYIHNLQGDVIGIYDSNGNIVCRYLYDSWGKIVSIKDDNGIDITDPTHIANVNPLRYRGYYYDSETGLYYLQSRYYNPEWCRFLNADGLFIAGDEITAANMFSYCGNNPVMHSDPSGHALSGFTASFINVLSNLLFSIGKYISAFFSSEQGIQMMADANRMYNRSLEQPDEFGNYAYINGQGTNRWKNYKYGASTFENNGCGPIALFNLLRLCGKSPNLPDLIYYLETHYSAIFFGELGTDTYSLNAALYDFGGVSGTGHSTYASFNKVLSSNQVVRGLVGYWTGSGTAHYVAFLKTGNSYLVFNDSSFGSDGNSYASLNDLFSQGKFIYGITVIP